MSLHRLLDEVKKSLRPDTSLLSHQQEVIEHLNQEFEKREIDAHAYAGGSTAKNTYLAGDHDIDIFARFSLSYADLDSQLPDLLAPCLKRFRPERLHGSRDYFQFEHDGYDFEVIPVLAVEDYSQARNITDMSPLHVMYFSQKNTGVEDEIRLAKQFCKAAGVYGAESYVGGFSGHVIDLLVLHYGSFMHFVKHAAKWETPVTIDLEGHHEDALSAIDASRHSPLILVDPVQPDRNAAAALSQEGFDTFVQRCKEFLQAPSATFFVIPTFSEKNLREHVKSQAGKGLIVHCTHDKDDKKDVAGARIRKAFERLRAEFARADFTLVEDGWHFSYRDTSTLWYVVEEHSLPRMTEHQGPPTDAGVDATRFRDQHSDVYERDGRLYTKVERAITLPSQVITSFADELREQLGVKVSLPQYHPGA